MEPPIYISTNNFYHMKNLLFVLLTGLILFSVPDPPEGSNQERVNIVTADIENADSYAITNDHVVVARDPVLTQKNEIGTFDGGLYTLVEVEQAATFIGNISLKHGAKSEDLYKRIELFQRIFYNDPGSSIGDATG